jgi:LPS O-antigen subunit length determinant protein (WzzB/FepE family)
MTNTSGSPQMQMFASIWSVLWRARYWEIGGVVAGVAAALLLAATTPKRYRAEAVYSPPSQSQAGGLAGIMAQFGGLSALAGLGLGQDANTANSLATLRGPGFTSAFIRKQSLERKLFPDRWDESGKRWTSPEPTDLELVKAFDAGGVRTIIEDRRTGLTTVRIEWRDPVEAVTILNSMMALANEELRQSTIEEARRSIDVLAVELEKTSAVDLRQTINTLIATNLKQSVLASIRQDFAFHLVSAPIVPTERDFVWPRRMLMAAGGLVIGGLLGLALWLSASAASPLAFFRRRIAVGPGA